MLIQLLSELCADPAISPDVAVRPDPLELTYLRQGDMAARLSLSVRKCLKVIDGYTIA